MRKVLGLGLSAAAVIATGLIPTAAGAAVSAPSEDTPVTFTVNVGALSITVPDSASLSSVAPGNTATAQVGSVTVTDDRALLAATWTATASSTAFKTAGGSGLETIPVTAVSYDPGDITTTGTITATGTALTPMSGAAQPVVTGTAGSGNNIATWNPTLAVVVPASAVGGLYSGTLSQSVS